jgi:N-acetylmuramoyl-L-alanine amidase
MSDGEKVLDIASGHVGEEYVLGVLVPKNNRNWRGPWDCAEFVSWCVYQASEKLFGCDNDKGDPSSADAYTGYWNRDVSNLGKEISVDTAAQTPGAVVLRIPQPNLMGHVVISDGKGGTVEAHSNEMGVIRSQLNDRRWDTGILIPGLEYAQNEGPVIVAPPAVLYRLTDPFMKGRKVREIQANLKENGFDPGILDGKYGPKTAAAVAAFQLTKGLVPDGEVGPKTAAALGIVLSKARQAGAKRKKAKGSRRGAS